MTAQQVVVGIYLLLERGGVSNLVERTRTGARALGFPCSNAQVSAWLSEFIVHKPTDVIRAANGRLHGRRTEARTESRTEPSDGTLSTIRTEPSDGTVGRNDGLARANCISNSTLSVVEESNKLRLFNSSPTRVDEQQRDKEGVDKNRRRDLKLPFDREILDARDAILKAVWSELQPVIGRSTTYTDWRKRNSNIARSFAAGHFKPTQIVAAWRQVSRARGEPVRELYLVQKHIETLQVAVRMRDGFHL